jgi:AraC-like DNA-binding protein
LHGLHEQWIKTRNLQQALYSHLPRGNPLFEVNLSSFFKLNRAAEWTGFSTPSLFAVNVKKPFGVSPSEY